jgi:hypothetical protein
MPPKRFTSERVSKTIGASAGGDTRGVADAESAVAVVESPDRAASARGASDVDDPDAVKPSLGEHPHGRSLKPLAR